MSAAWGHAAGVFTVLLMLAFLGIWAWAWLPRHRGPFDQLARLPMEDPVAPADESSPATETDARR